MTVYDRGAALANKILGSEKGETGAIRRMAESEGFSYVAFGDKPAETDYPCRLAAFPVDQKDVDGTLIRAGDWLVLVATGITAEQAAGWATDKQVGDFTTVTPEPNDFLVCSQGVLTVIDAGKFAPAGTVTHYKMIARKA